MSATVDLVIDAGWIIPVAPDETQSLQDHSLVIHDGKIADILPTPDACAKYSPDEHLDRKSCVVLPGLINAHTHAGLTLMRGKADDMPLLPWLHEAVWPMEAAFSCKREFCLDSTMLAIAEMIRSGITCFADMYFYPSMAARAVLDTRMRAIIGMVIIAFPSAYAATPDEYIERGQAIMHEFRDEPNIHFAYAPHAPYSVKSATWDAIRDFSEKDNIPVHTHLHETEDECTASLALDRDNPACHQSDTPCHPVQDFDNRKLLNSRLVAVHMVHLTDDEIALCAKRSVNIVHCPTSNAKLASGFAPVHRMLAAGLNVALGTDSACSNNSLDLLAEMKLAALNAKNLARDATVLPASTAIRMGTLNGARAFGIDDITGSLQVGKAADVVTIDLGTHAANTPMFNPHAAVVYASSRDDVRDVLVAGEILLRDKQYCTIDVESILEKAKHWQAQILKQFPMQ